MICTKNVCTPAQCENYLPAIQETLEICCSSGNLQNRQAKSRAILLWKAKSRERARGLARMLEAREGKHQEQ